MKNLVFFTLLLCALGVSEKANAQGSMEFGHATTYEITMQKMELCASGSSIDSTGASAPVCIDPYVISTSTATFDIASVLAGAAIGNYANIGVLPAGTTYTHIRVTLTRRFDVAGLLSTSGCRTDINDTTSSATSPGHGIRDSGTGTPQALYLADIGGYGGGHPTAAEYWADGVEILSSTNFRFMHALTQSVAGGGTPPTITISFNTLTALAGEWDGDSEQCLMFPAPPSAEITIQ
jgi:hypothetical protein